MSKFYLLYERKNPATLKKYEKKVERTLRKGRPKVGDETAGVELYNALIDSGKSFDQAIEAIATKFGIKPETAEDRLKRHGIRRPSEGELAKRKGKPKPKLQRYTDAVRQRLFKNPSLTYKTDNGKLEKKFHRNKIMLPRLRLPDQPSVRGDTAWIGSLDATSISLQFQKMSRIKEMNVVRVVVDIPRPIFAELDSKQLGHVLSACAKSLPVYERQHRPDVLVFDRMDITNAQHKDAWTTLRDGIQSVGYKHAMVSSWDVFAKDEKKLAAFKRAAGRPNINEDMQLCEFEETIVLYPLVLEGRRLESALRYGGIAAMSAGLGIGAVEGSKAIWKADQEAKQKHEQKQKERGPSTRTLFKKHGVVDVRDIKEDWKRRLRKELTGRGLVTRFKMAERDKASLAQGNYEQGLADWKSEQAPKRRKDAQEKMKAARRGYQEKLSVVVGKPSKESLFKNLFNDPKLSREEINARARKEILATFQDEREAKKHAKAAAAHFKRRGKYERIGKRGFRGLNPLGKDEKENRRDWIAIRKMIKDKTGNSFPGPKKQRVEEGWLKKDEYPKPAPINRRDVEHHDLPTLKRMRDEAVSASTNGKNPHAHSHARNAQELQYAIGRKEKEDKRANLPRLVHKETD